MGNLIFTIADLSISSIAFTLCFPIIIWILYHKSRREAKLINKLPTPQDLPIVGSSLYIDRSPPGFYKQIIGFCERYRSERIFKLKFGFHCNSVIFTADEVEKLLRSYAHIDKSSLYVFTHRWLGLGLLTSTGSKWKSRRRMLTPSFHFKILKDALETMNEHAINLRDKLVKDVCDNKQHMDIFQDLTLVSLDIISETAMGVKLDALHDNESEYVKAVYLAKDSISMRMRTPWLWPDFIFYSLGIGRKVDKAIKLMHQHAHKVIRERKEVRTGVVLPERHKVFIDTLLDCTDENGEHLTDEGIREEVDTFMFEGHDTVSSALGFVTHLLGLHPEIQKKCQEELDSIIGAPRNMTIEDLSKMTYLEWCIKEAMRLFPSVPFFGRDVTEDIELAGYTIPKGASDVIVIAAALHRDPQVFPDPEKFDPTRFSPDNCAKRHPYAYLPFSAGPRNCIGQRFAMMELKVLIATLLLNFNLRSTQQSSELVLNPGIVLQPSNGIWVELSTR